MRQTTTLPYAPYDPYGLGYEPSVGWDSAEVTTTRPPAPRGLLQSISDWAESQSDAYQRSLNQVRGAVDVPLPSGEAMRPSAVNMLLGGIGTAARWLQGDTSQLLAHDMLAPVGTGVAASMIAARARPRNMLTQAEPGPAAQRPAIMSKPMTVHGYRGYDPEYGIGPAHGRIPAVWATPDRAIADAFAGSRGVTVPVEMRFERPFIVDAGGAHYESIPVREGNNVLERAIAPKTLYDINDLAGIKMDAGYDGMVVRNVAELDKHGRSRTADQHVALQRGTVFDPNTGGLLWSDASRVTPRTVAVRVPPAQAPSSESWRDEILRRYGLAGAETRRAVP